MKRVTLKDVAKKLDIAYSTVSMAINDDKAISGKMKELVNRTIVEMGYYPNKTARSLVKGMTNNIAVVVPGFFSMYEMHIIRGMEESIINSQFDLVLYGARYDWDEVHNEMRKILYGNSADAVIVVGVILEEGLLEEYNRAGIPVVVIDGGESKNAYMLNVDNYYCGKVAAERFIRNGKKNPALLVGNTRFVYSQAERLRGFKETLEAGGVALKPSRVFESIEYLPDMVKAIGRKGAELFFADGVDCIYCANGDYAAQGAFNYLTSKGVRMPDGISLIGTDNFDVADALGITSIEQPLVETGRKAFKKAEELVKEKKFIYLSESLKSKIIERNT
jgi:LacI family transcriptional regulator